MTIRDMRNYTGLSQSKFAMIFHMPVTSIQRWEQGISSPPDYVKYLMEYKLQKEGYIKDEAVDD